MSAKKSVGMKAVVLLLAVVLLIGCTVGGTLAWLIAQSETVTNTFTVGNINIELKEHALGTDGKLTETEITAINTYKILPGTEQPKDPFVRIAANSEDCWVFVQIKETNNTASADLKYVTWAIADGWTLLESKDGVSTYYRTQSYTTATDAQTYAILSKNQVAYSSDLTKAMIDSLQNNTPTLIFKAFAVQSDAATSASAAWGKVASNEKLS